jgi:hypothetical protein
MVAGRGNPDDRGKRHITWGPSMTQWWNARAGASGGGCTPARIPGAGRRAVQVLALAAVFTSGACASPAEDASQRASLTGAATVEPTTEPPTPASQITPDPTGGPTPVAGKPWDAEATAACEAGLAGKQLGTLQQVAQVRDEQGVTSFWAHGRRWALCDVAPDAAPTIVPDAGAAGFDTSAFGIDAAPVEVAGKQAVRYVAGGLLPWPVDEIAYTFPDGHTEQARFVRSEGSDDLWWAVTYTATDGVLADPAADPETLGPVTISVVGPAAEGFRLPWKAVQRNE